MKRSLLILTVGVSATLTLGSCQNALRQARQAAESTANPEMHRVVEHFRDDPEKLRAATYLFEGLSDHGTHTFDLIDVSGQPTRFNLYRPGVTSGNYQSLLDSARLTLRRRTESDAQTMTADYMIRNIDQAFESWRNNPWSRSYSDSLFQAYILPYRIDAEELTDWRSFFQARYTPMVDTLTGPKTVRNVARMIIRDLRSWYGFHPEALMLKPMLTPQEALEYHWGECNSIASMYVLAFRAMGIAATKDVIPIWGNSNGGHAEAVYFDEEGNPVMLDTGAWLGANPPKVYRVEFHRLSDARNVLGNPHYRDVTADYVATSCLSVPFNDAPADGEHPTLAVFRNDRWQPVILAAPGQPTVYQGESASPTSATEQQGSSAYRFEQVGRSILYLPVYAMGRSVRLAGQPFQLDARGNIQRFTDSDTSQRVEVDLTTLIRPQDLDTLHYEDYQVAYWFGGEWRLSEAPIRRHPGATPQQTTYSVTHVPRRSLCLLVDRHSGRSYFRRIFNSWDSIPERF